MLTVDAKTNLGQHTGRVFRRPRGCVQPADGENQSVNDRTDLEIDRTDVELVLDRVSSRTLSGKIRREDARGGYSRIGKPPRIAGSLAGRRPNNKVEGWKR